MDIWLEPGRGGQGGSRGEVARAGTGAWRARRAQARARLGGPMTQGARWQAPRRPSRPGRRGQPGSGGDLDGRCSRTMMATDARIIAAPTSIVGRDRLAQDEPAERDRHHRVDVRVGRDPRDRRVLEQPREGREGDERPEDDEVARGRPGTASTTWTGSTSAISPASTASHEPEQAARDELVERGHERVARQAHAAAT